ncbi:MAG: hypothetical protein ACF788_11280 [Novipirellula sp. JB048]
MSSNHSRSDAKPSEAKPWAIGLILVAALALAWWGPRSRVELDEVGYDVTIALYRVCNQRSAAGLIQIEQQMQKLELDSGPQSASSQAIRHIIATAKAGQWQQAAKRCRRALEDQVHR